MKWNLIFESFFHFIFFYKWKFFHSHEDIHNTFRTVCLKTTFVTHPRNTKLLVKILFELLAEIFVHEISLWGKCKVRGLRGLQSGTAKIFFRR